MYDLDSLKEIYGYSEDFEKVLKLRIDSSRQIYEELMNDILVRNNSLIPSRNEKRSRGIKWSVAWKNWSKLRGVDATEREFAWKIQQDMLNNGSRLHRLNADKRCMLLLDDGTNCVEIETREHLFVRCETVVELFSVCSDIIKGVLEKNVGVDEILHLSFNHRCKSRLTVAVWFAVKAMFKIYQNNQRNKMQLLLEIIKEIDWNLDLNRKIGSINDMRLLKDRIKLSLGL